MSEKFEDWFNKNVCTNWEGTQGLFNKVWFKIIWDYKEQKIEKLEEENKKLTKDLNTVAEMNIHNSSVHKREIKKIEDENKVLSGRVETLDKERTWLHGLNLDLQQKIKDLEEYNQLLQQNNKDAMTRNVELSKRIIEVNGFLHVKNEKLKEAEENLSGKFDGISDQLEQANYILEEVKDNTLKKEYLNNLVVKYFIDYPKGVTNS